MKKPIFFAIILLGLQSCIVEKENTDVPTISQAEISSLIIESRLAIVEYWAKDKNDTLPKTTVYPYDKIASASSPSIQLIISISNFPRKRMAKTKYLEKSYFNDTLMDSLWYGTGMINTCCGTNYTGKTGMSITTGPNPYIKIGEYKYIYESYLENETISKDTVIISLPKLVVP